MRTYTILYLAGASGLLAAVPASGQTSASPQTAPKCVAIQPSAAVDGRPVSLGVTYCTDEFGTTEMLGQDGAPLPAWPAGEAKESATGLLATYRQILTKSYKPETLQTSLGEVQGMCKAPPADMKPTKVAEFCGDLLFYGGDYAGAQSQFIQFTRLTLNQKSPKGEEKTWGLYPALAAAIEIAGAREPNRKLALTLATVAAGRGFARAKSWMPD